MLSWGCEWEMNAILTHTLNKAGLIDKAKIILLGGLLKIYPTDWFSEEDIQLIFIIINTWKYNEIRWIITRNIYRCLQNIKF